MASAWDFPRPRWKHACKEVTVFDEGALYRAVYTCRFPGVDELIQEVRGETYQELAERLERLPSPYFLHGRQLLWEELVEASKDFEILKQSAEDDIRRGYTGEDCATIFWPNVSRWARYKPHGPKKRREEREERKARAAELREQKRKESWALIGKRPHPKPPKRI